MRPSVTTRRLGFKETTLACTVMNWPQGVEVGGLTDRNAVFVAQPNTMPATMLAAPACKNHKALFVTFLYWPSPHYGMDVYKESPV